MEITITATLLLAERLPFVDFTCYTTIHFPIIYGYDLRLYHGPDLCSSRILCFHLYSEQASKRVLSAEFLIFLLAFSYLFPLLHSSWAGEQDRGYRTVQLSIAHTSKQAGSKKHEPQRRACTNQILGHIFNMDILFAVNVKEEGLRLFSHLRRHGAFSPSTSFGRHHQSHLYTNDITTYHDLTILQKPLLPRTFYDAKQTYRHERFSRKHE